jgi:hypothetical protein
MIKFIKFILALVASSAVITVNLNFSIEFSPTVEVTNAQKIQQLYVNEWAEHPT